MVSRAIEVSNLLESNGIEATVINSRFLKPFDECTLLNNINNLVVTIEDGTIIGGLGSKVEELMQKNKIYSSLIKCAYPDEFIKHGNTDEIEKKYGLDAKSIAENIEYELNINKIPNIDVIKKNMKP